jgi:hypothetical protein
VFKFDNAIIAILPVAAVIEGNSFEHWQKKHKRHVQQKKYINLALSSVIRQISLPCTIYLTRYSPRLLDQWDNLPMSFKWILDQICESLIPGKRPGRADDDKRISVKYFQEKSKEKYIKIIIESNKA